MTATVSWTHVGPTEHAAVSLARVQLLPTRVQYLLLPYAQPPLLWSGQCAGMLHHAFNFSSHCGLTMMATATTSTAISSMSLFARLNDSLATDERTG